MRIITFVASPNGEKAMGKKMEFSFDKKDAQRGKIPTPNGGGLPMRGGLYSDERCPLCDGKFIDNHRNGLVCKTHPDRQAATIIVRFKNTSRRVKSYDEAVYVLAGLRFKSYEGTYDERDYQKDRPLGFKALAEKWLTIKKSEVKTKSFDNLRRYIKTATAFYGDKNIKDIGYAEIEDFLLTQGGLSAKTRANMLSALHSFWTWLLRRRVIRLDQFPEFPHVEFESAYKTLVDKETQARILDEVYRLTKGYNLRIWYGCRLHCVYLVRPGELWNVREKDFVILNDLVGSLIIPHPKDKRPKTIPLLPDDIVIYRSFTRGLPETYFFRHEHCRYGGKRRVDGRICQDAFYEWFLKACKNLGIEGVNLYGGGKASSMHDLRDLGQEEIMRAAHISTNKASLRYIQPQASDNLKVYRAAAEKLKGQVVEFKQPPDCNDFVNAFSGISEEITIDNYLIKMVEGTTTCRKTVSKPALLVTH